MPLRRILAVLLLSTLVACSGGGPAQPDPQGPSLPATSLGESTVGAPFERSIAASAGAAPLSYSAQGLPPGIALESSSGRLSGSPTNAGSFDIDASVSDAGGRSDQRHYSLLVLEAPHFVSDSLPPANVGASYAVRIEATGGRAPLAYAFGGSSTPPGLTIDASGTLSGIPSAPGSYSFEISVTDAHGAVKRASFTLEVRGATPAFITTTLPDAYRNHSYVAGVEASGGTAPYTYAITSGTLPSGVQFDSAGHFSGTPSVSGAFGLSLTVTDAAQQSSTRAFSLTVLEPPGFASSTLRDGVVGSAYSDTLQPSGGKAPFSFRIIAGVLPAGLQLSGSSITGTPTAGGTASFTVELRDANDQAATQVFSLRVSSTVAITSAAPPDAYTDTPYSFALTAAGGVAPYRWEPVSGAPPSGITLSSSGQLAGTASMAGSASFTVSVSDADNATATKTLSLTAYAPPVLAATAPRIAYVSDVITLAFTVSGGKTPYSFSRSGSLPPGLSLNASSGLLQGTLTGAGSFSFDVTAADTNGRTSSRTNSFTVYALPSITSTSLANGDTGQPYSVQLAATGGQGSLSWSFTGTLPPGLSLASSGTLSGTPTTAGVYSFTARVTDTGNKTDSRSLNLVIQGPPAVSTSSLADGYVASPYSVTLLAAGGHAPLSWSYTGSLPPGVSLSSSGVLSGTPTSEGSFTFTARVTDSLGREGTRSLSLSIYRPPSLLPIVLGDAYVSEPYDTFVIASGGKPPRTFSITSGSLPAGISLSSAGELTGTPTVAGPNSFAVTVSDANGLTGTRSFTITVYSPPTITTTSLPAAQRGQPYSQTLAVSGGKPGYLFVPESGAPPAGISLDVYGALTGTPTGSTSTFSVRVYDTNSRSDVRTFTLTVEGSPPETLFTVGQWNLEWFGSETNGPPRSSSGDGTSDDLQIANARDVIQGANADLWGLVEMVDTADFQTLKAQLPGYSGFLADDPIVFLGSSYYSAGEQKPGVLYDSRLTLQSAGLILTSWDADFAGRPPLRVDFTTTIHGTPSTLTVIVLHMKAFEDRASYDRRQRAAGALKSYIDSNLPSGRVLVLGDWNDDVDVSISTDTTGTPLPSPYENFLAAPSAYTFITRPLSLAGVASTVDFPDMIDHTLATDEAMVDSVPDSVHVQHPNIPDYAGTTSDHYPVFSQFDFGPP